MFNFALLWNNLSLVLDIVLYSVGIYRCGVDNVSQYVNETAATAGMAAFPFKHYSGTCFGNDSLHLINSSDRKEVGDISPSYTVHVQTAGHSAGAAFYYQRHHVNPEPASWADRVVFGVSANAAYKDNVRFSGVIIMEELKVSQDFQSPEPDDVFPLNQEKIELLEKYNNQGQQ
ncbi:MMACHC [Bugula neritina]|uniref:Cyanocobalamin reductase (cyanide-eliminating) n=1 Tax=Bugula neritina TaxID=10212 RepID=A0A7J7KDG5_BUGNE|nr:MMACHC [Bugula neritina]